MTQKSSGTSDSLSNDLSPSRSASAAAPTAIPISADAQVLVWSDGGQAVIRIEAQGRQTLELSIKMTDEGPILKACAHAVELQADRFAVDCREFSVHAQERLSLKSDGDMVSVVGGKQETTANRIDMEATHGSVVVRANDDVQLLGEQLLLNCERQAPLPRWLPRIQAEAPQAHTLPLSAVSGDASLLHDLVQQSESSK
jgi:hypothetical protein